MVGWDGERGWGEANKFTHFWVFSGGLSTGEVRGTHVALLSPCMDTAPIHPPGAMRVSSATSLRLSYSSSVGLKSYRHLYDIHSFTHHPFDEHLWSIVCAADSGPHPWSSKTVVKRKQNRQDSQIDMERGHWKQISEWKISSKPFFSWINNLWSHTCGLG